MTRYSTKRLLLAAYNNQIYSFRSKQSLCQTTPWIGTKVAFILPDLYTQTMSPSPGIPGISDLSLPLNKLNIEKINSKKGELI